jgi:hypothetical protein
MVNRSAKPGDGVSDLVGLESPPRPTSWAYPYPERGTVKESNTLNASSGLLAFVPVLVRVAFCNGLTVGPA